MKSMTCRAFSVALTSLLACILMVHAENGADAWLRYAPWG
jgi:hypothetical protein